MVTAWFGLGTCCRLEQEQEAKRQRLARIERLKDEIQEKHRRSRLDVALAFN